MKPLPTLGLLLILVGGCAVPPPTSQRLVTHSAVTDQAGTMLIVDVCINYSPLDGEDYFVIHNAKQGAAALEAATLRFLDVAEVRVRTKLVPFVCGALHDAANSPKRAAEEINGPVTARAQPLWVASDLRGDSEYVAALQTISTYTFRSALASYGSAAPEMPLDHDSARRASALIAQKSGRSSLLYVGVSGNSLSTGKAFAIGAARAVAGVAMSFAVGPVFATPTTNYYVVFVPGGPVDRRQMVAGLFDLNRGELVSSRVVHAGGDPMKPEVLSQRDALDLLLRELVFTTGVPK